MRILYMATSGSADPSRASIPIHLAINGSVEVGHDTGVLLAGDATELVRADTRAAIEGIGLPPMRELFEKLTKHAVPVYV